MALPGPTAALWDVDTQRTIIGLLLEKLGGSVTLTAKDLVTSAVANGRCDLYVQYTSDPVNGDSLTLETIPSGKGEH